MLFLAALFLAVLVFDAVVLAVLVFDAVVFAVVFFATVVVVAGAVAVLAAVDAPLDAGRLPNMPAAPWAIISNGPRPSARPPSREANVRS